MPDAQIAARVRNENRLQIFPVRRRAGGIKSGRMPAIPPEIADVQRIGATMKIYETLIGAEYPHPLNFPKRLLRIRRVLLPETLNVAPKLISINYIAAPC